MSRSRVLHIDDEADIREVVEIALSLDPHLTVQSCGSGDQALSVAAQWLPHIILLDVMMPKMDGPATLKRLRETSETADIPVVFMTARAQSREIETFKSLGAVGVIAKPFDPMTLAALLRTYLAPPENRLDDMRIEFLQRVEKDLAALARQWSNVLCAKTGTVGLEKMRGVAHGLAGAGGLFGFREISMAAARLEEAVMSNCGALPGYDEIQSAFNQLNACAQARSERDRINT
jgi:CheY-like chemotaxis protein